MYHIADEEQQRNSKGGLFVRFCLQRKQNDQPALQTVTVRPTAAEIADEARVKEA